MAGKLKPDFHITINGQPLSEFVGEDLNLEVNNVRVDIIAEITKCLPRKIVSKGRRPGNPGVRKARKLTAAEVEAENIRRGLIPMPRRGA
jgi:hypothetical protein